MNEGKSTLHRLARRAAEQVLVKSIPEASACQCEKAAKDIADQFITNLNIHRAQQHAALSPEVKAKLQILAESKDRF